MDAEHTEEVCPNCGKAGRTASSPCIHPWHRGGARVELQARIAALETAIEDFFHDEPHMSWEHIAGELRGALEGRYSERQQLARNKVRIEVAG